MATANTLSMSTLFPPQLTNKVFQLTRGKSVLDKLSSAEPIPFTGSQEFTFSLDNEIDVVAENGQKSAGGASIAAVKTIPIKVEYGMRVSDEFLNAAEEARINYLEPAVEGFAKKLARGRDIMAIYGVNPRTGSASTVIGTNNFLAKVSQAVTQANGETADALIERGIAQVQAGEGDVDGIALGNSLRADLAALTTSGGAKMYPDLAWGGTPDSINGQRVAAGPTVEYDATTKLCGIVGNFGDAYRWGYAKDISMEVIPYGDPDNTGVDLKGSNQVYLRFEAYIGWAILDPSQFCLIKRA
ncbi:MAG: phage major capsid protein [Oscillospiraceae bacterium]|nr:phage major capsid protein [Oscillospiraceae bacterium]